MFTVYCTDSHWRAKVNCLSGVLSWAQSWILAWVYVYVQYMGLKENKSLASWLKTEHNKVEFPTCMPVFFRGFQVQEVNILSHLSNVDALEHFLYFFTRSDHNKLYLNKATGCLADRGIPRLLCAQCHHTSPSDCKQHSYSSTHKTTFSKECRNNIQFIQGFL